MSSASGAEEGPGWDESDVCVEAPTVVASPEGPAAVGPSPKGLPVPDPEGPASVASSSTPDGPAPAGPGPEAPAEVDGLETVMGGWLKE